MSSPFPSHPLPTRVDSRESIFPALEVGRFAKEEEGVGTLCDAVKFTAGTKRLIVFLILPLASVL